MADKLWQDGWVVVPVVRSMNETVYGVKTHYVHAGEGEPLVLVHGGGPGASGESGWARAIPALCPYFHVYALDLIGSGYTDKPLIDYSFQTEVEHLAGFIDALNLDQVRLCGNSQGAYDAIKYALDWPRRVKQVVLIGSGTLATACGIQAPARAAPLPRFDGTRESLRAFIEVIVNDHSKITDELIDARYAAAMLPGHREKHESMGRYRQVVVEHPSERQVYDVKRRLEQLTVPWSMIWGGGDRSAPLDPLGNGLHEMFPQVPFHVVEGSGHQVQNDKPKECNRLLLESFGVAVRETVRA